MLKLGLLPTLLPFKHEAVAGGRQWWIFETSTFFGSSKLIFLIKYLLPHNGNGQSSTHRLKLGLQSTLLPFKHHETETGIIWRRVFISFNFLPLFFCYLSIFFQFNIYNPIMETAKAQPTCWSWASCPHSCHAKNSRQQQVYFGDEWSFLLCIYYCSLAMFQDFSQLNTYNLIIGTVKTQPAGWSLATCPRLCHATNIRQRQA